MKPGIRYIVIKKSKDSTLLVGDKISISDDGCITLHDGDWTGWLTKEDSEIAIKGMECKVDKAWIESEKERLRDELKRLNEI